MSQFKEVNLAVFCRARARLIEEIAATVPLESYVPRALTKKEKLLVATENMENPTRSERGYRVVIYDQQAQAKIIECFALSTHSKYVFLAQSGLSQKEAIMFNKQARTFFNQRGF